MRYTGASAVGAHGCGRDGGPGPDHEVGQRGRGRRFQLSGRLHRFVELARDRQLHRLDDVVGDARGLQPARVDEQRIARFPLANLVGGAVALGVAFVVAVPPVGGRLDDGRARADADRGDHLAHGGCRFGDVVAVHREVVDAVAGCALLERRRVLLGRGRELRVAVVLAEEDHGELPHRGEVQRFVERALRGRTVAEERNRDAAVGAELRRGCRSDRDRQAGRDDAVRAEDPDVRVGDVHRAAAPAVRALLLSHQLGEHPERRETLREAVAVAAMRRRDDVGGSERPARADGGRLLPDRQVHEARNFAVAVQRGHALLEAADHEHPPMHLEEVGVGEHEVSIVLTGTKRKM